MRFLTMALSGLLLCALGPWDARAFEVACGDKGPETPIPAGTVHIVGIYHSQEEADAVVEDWTLENMKDALRTFLPPGSFCGECWDPEQCWEHLRYSNLQISFYVEEDPPTGQFSVEITFDKDSWVGIRCDPCVMCGGGDCDAGGGG